MRAYLRFQLPIALAHRGGAALWPENTLVAFRGAIELGYKYIETDAWLSRDGQIVLFHDPTLERTTDGRGRIADRTLTELKRLDAGYRFTSDGGRTYPWRGKGVRIPTLEEALELASDLRFNIEIKARGKAPARAMWKAIQRYGLHDRILIAAEHTPTSLAFRGLARGRVATSASFHECFAFWLMARLRVSRLLPVGFDALQVPEVWRGMQVVDRRFVEAAHARGLHVHVWTVNELEAMQRLRALGVDGLITDRPDRLPPFVG